MPFDYDVIIVGAGPGGVFSAWELSRLAPEKKIAVFELGRPLDQRRCPIDGKNIKSCVKCPVCSIMSGFGGAGAFSDGKYNITNQFGGTLFEYIGKQEALELMRYVDETPDSSAAASRTACTCSTRRCGISARISTMWCWKTSTTSSKSGWTSFSTALCSRSAVKTAATPYR